MFDLIAVQDFINPPPNMTPEQVYWTLASSFIISMILVVISQCLAHKAKQKR